MNEKQINELAGIFKQYPQVKLAYFFGSRAKGKEGPLSDYDFAIYVDERDEKKILDIRVGIQEALSRYFKTDKVDVPAINTIESPELKYSIVSEGKLIFEVEPYKLLVEPRVFNEYFDFTFSLKRYGLIKS